MRLTLSEPDLYLALFFLFIRTFGDESYPMIHPPAVRKVHPCRGRNAQGLSPTWKSSQLKSFCTLASRGAGIVTEVKRMRVRACVLQRHVWGEASSEDPVSKWGCFCETPGGSSLGDTQTEGPVTETSPAFPSLICRLKGYCRDVCQWVKKRSARRSTNRVSC